MLVVVVLRPSRDSLEIPIHPVDQILSEFGRVVKLLARWNIHHQLRQIRDGVTESHQEEIDQLTSEYDDVVSAVRTLEETAEAWEESAADLWETIGDELREQKPDLPEPPTARPANEPDGFVLFDSKRDYLNQMDAYREWQRR